MALKATPERTSGVENASQARAGSGSRAVAALSNLAIGNLNAAGHRNIAG
jgi:hypothetical protein